MRYQDPRNYKTCQEGILAAVADRAYMVSGYMAEGFTRQEAEDMAGQTCVKVNNFPEYEQLVTAGTTSRRFWQSRGAYYHNKEDAVKDAARRGTTLWANTYADPLDSLFHAYATGDSRPGGMYCATQ